MFQAYELREYDASKWVSTEMLNIDHSQAQRMMFMKLFGYIQGANENSKCFFIIRRGYVQSTAISQKINNNKKKNNKKKQQKKEHIQLAVAKKTVKMAIYRCNIISLSQRKTARCFI